MLYLVIYYAANIIKTFRKNKYFSFIFFNKKNFVFSLVFETKSIIFALHN